MEVINGQWIMYGVESDSPSCLHSSDELLSVIERVGFMPLFSNSISGFSVENMTDPASWWTGDVETDPWEWRTVLARSGAVAYGKFFGGRAGFISRKWFPYFVNRRRSGYDFDAAYSDGMAGYREKLLMDLFVPEDTDMWDVDVSSLSDLGRSPYLYTFEMKDKGGFGKGGEKNFEGTLTKLQMQTYLVVKDFRPRLNRKGNEYGWAVAVMTPPEYIWGYEYVTGRYKESPEESLAAMVRQVAKHFSADEKTIRKIL